MSSGLQRLFEIKSLRNNYPSLAILTVFLLSSFLSYAQTRTQPTTIYGKQKFADSVWFSKLKNTPGGDYIISTDTSGKLVLVPKPIIDDGTTVEAGGVDSIVVYPNGDWCSFTDGVADCHNDDAYYSTSTFDFDKSEEIYYNRKGDSIHATVIPHVVAEQLYPVEITKLDDTTATFGLTQSFIDSLGGVDTIYRTEDSTQLIVVLTNGEVKTFDFATDGSISSLPAGLQEVTDVNTVTTNQISANGFVAKRPGYYQDVAALTMDISGATSHGKMILKSWDDHGAILTTSNAFSSTQTYYLPNATGYIPMTVNGQAADLSGNITTPLEVVGQEFTGSTSTTLTLSQNYITGTIKLYKNGLRLKIADFTEATSNTITLNVARLVGDVFQADFNY